MLTPSLLIALASLAADPAPTAPALEPVVTTPGVAAFTTLAGAQDAPAPDAEAPAEPPSWDGNIAFGAGFATGNTNTRSVNFTFDSQLDRSQLAASNRWTLKAWYNFQDEKTAGTPGYRATSNNIYGSVQYDHFLSEKDYVYGNISGQGDELQDLDLRLIVGAGYGRQFRNDEVLVLDGELGLAYRKEVYENSPDTESPNARVAANVVWKFREGWGLLNSTEVLPSLEDASDVFVQADTRVRTELNKDLFLQLQWLFTYNGVPAPTKDTTDNRLILTLGWSF